MSGADLLAAFARPAGEAVNHGGAPLAWGELVGRAAALAARMPPATPGSEVAFAFERDRLAFVAALLATWMRGHTAVVPEDAERDSVAPLLARAGHVLLVHDTGVGRGLHVPALLAQELGAAPSEPRPFERERPALVAVRRRAFGAPALASWSAAQLVARVDALAARLELAPGACVASTLSPTALPGMLLGVLASLRRRARIGAEVPASLADAAAEARVTGAEVLVTSAAHARAFAARRAGALGAVRVLACVDETPGSRHAALLARRHGAQALLLRDLEPAEALPDELEALRETLLAREDVRDAGVLVVPGAAGAAPAALIGVVAEERAHAELAALVARHAGANLPCLVRFLPALARDRNGRLAAARHLLAFGRGRSGRELVRTLEWSEVSDADPAARRFRARLPEDYAFFEGHFPGYPVLAGVAQLHELVLPCVRRVAPGLGALVRLQRVKFLARIAPGDELDVVLRAGAEPGELVFALERAGVLCSAGRVRLRPAGDAG